MSFFNVESAVLVIVVVVNNDVMEVIVAFACAIADGTCILEHWGEIGYYDGLGKKVFASAKE